MKEKFKKYLAVFLVLGMIISLAACGTKNESEETWPQKPITIVVGYGAGGGSDLIARKVSEGMSEYLGVPINILNVAGGSASIAGQQVSDAPSDGLTLLAGPMNVASPWRVCDYADIGWENFYSMIGAKSWYALFVSKDSEFKTYQDLYQYARENPGQLKWGHSGYGSLNQVSGDMMLDIAGIDAVSVPYSGGAEAATKVIAGETQFTWLPLNDAADFVSSGDLVALGIAADSAMTISTVNGDYEAPSLLDEYPDMSALNGLLGWGLHVKRDTEPSHVARLMEAFDYAVNTDSYKDFCESINVVPANLMGEESDKQISFLESFVSWGLYGQDMTAEGISPEDFDIPTVSEYSWPPNERAAGATPWPAQ